MTIQVVKVPLAKMTFSPDVPSAALGPNEYNAGKNVETDVRGIRSVAGDQEILNYVPGTPTFVTGGYRSDGNFWFVVATTEGNWYASNGIIDWYNINPTNTTYDFTGYNQATNITEAWNGNTLILNDEQNPPMFWPDNGQSQPILVMYDNGVPIEISAIVVNTASLTTKVISFSTATTYTTPPYQVGTSVVVSGVDPRYYNGTFVVSSCTTSTVTVNIDTTQPYASGGQVAYAYTWNYDPNWESYYAKFLRIYNSPNVGSILVAGNLTVTPITTSTQVIYPVTVQWSQNFGLNEVPVTWEPTVVNVANQLEVPLRGPALDAFPCNGLFFLCSYWDTVVFSPLNYSTTSAPVLGVRQFNQGRGLLSSNCWANTDKFVYGVDARDIWVFNGQEFEGIGNQRVKNWFYDQLAPEYYDRVYMETNTQKSQIEIYYPTSSATNGVPNKMISYRYDIDCWNAPRDVDSATFSTESPVWVATGTSTVTNTALPGSRCVVYARGCTDQNLLQKDQGFHFLDCTTSTGTSVILPIESEFRRDNIKVLPNYTNKLLVHRVLPEVVNLGALWNQDNEVVTTSTGQITITIEGANSVGSTATAITPVTLYVDADGNPGHDPWAQIDQNAFRVNTLVLSDSSTSTVWHCSATTWQIAQTEEDR
jgi:hypothetical protein